MRKIVRNCRLCQEMLVNSPFMLCATCLKESEQVFSFIKKNPFVTIKDIAVATGIACCKVERMIEYGSKHAKRRLKKEM